MNPSPLILERHFFPKVLIEAHPDGLADIPLQIKCDIEVGQDKKDHRHFQLALVITFHNLEGSKPHYTGEIKAVGLFRVADTIPQEKAQDLVEQYGAALLYGAIRELVINITARGPWPPLNLEVVSFVKGNVQEKDNPKP